MLRAGEAPPMDYAAFLDQCRGVVSDEVYRALETLTLRSDEGPLVKEWAVFHRVLSDELSYQRRIKRGENAPAPLERDAAVTQTVTASMKARSTVMHSSYSCSDGSAYSVRTRARRRSTGCSITFGSRYSAYKTGESTWEK